MIIKILFVFGTRPEAIKMAPLIKEMEKEEGFNIKVCVTGQHREMLDQVLSFFEIKPDFDLKLMKTNQTLADITSDVIKGVDSIIKNDFLPDYVVVQGDTTTAMAGALAASYSKVQVLHLEAGLRSNQKYSPFPEEINRMVISKIADMHFAPTAKAMNNLREEGIDESLIWNVGNTVIDALLLGIQKNKSKNASYYERYFEYLDADRKIILVTGHRRENFGERFEEICYALKTISERNPDVQIVYPVHLNPNVRVPVDKILKDCPGIHLIEPLDYSALIYLLDKSYIVVTDSGGIQEEAPALGKPVLVTRDVTERMEGVEAGTAKLVGTSFEKIISACQELLENKSQYELMAKAVNPYGDGTTSRQVVRILKELTSK